MSLPRAFRKLHHTAFDAFFLSIRPDYVIEIRERCMARRSSFQGARRIGRTGSGWRLGIRGF